MTLKQILEDLWNDNKVRCANHRTWWLDQEELDYLKRGPRGLEKVANADLWYARGEKVSTIPRP